jgi:ATP-dependent Clp protease, protease subunit
MRFLPLFLVFLFSCNCVIPSKKTLKMAPIQISANADSGIEQLKDDIQVLMDEVQSANDAGVKDKKVTVELRGLITPSLAKPIVDKIKELSKDDSVSEIWLRINSPGGQISVGNDIIDAIEAVPSSIKTVCVVDHDGFSMAAVILESCNERAMTKRSSIMYHEASVGGSGNKHQLLDAINLLKVQDKAISEFVSGKMKMPLKEWMERVNGKEWYLDVDDALKYHAIDRVVDPKDIPLSIEVKSTETNFFQLF